jgi:hypothetical protein
MPSCKALSQPARKLSMADTVLIDTLTRYNVHLDIIVLRWFWRLGYCGREEGIGGWSVFFCIRGAD